MANEKKCVTCGKSYIVSNADDKEIYYCHQCERVWQEFWKQLIAMKRAKKAKKKNRRA